MTAVSGEDLKERGISNVADLIRDIPGVSAKAGGTGQTEYTIRGLSSSAGVAPTVGFYLDDVPLSSPTVSSGGMSPVDPDLYDLARVEVLRGPQGTLYGASSMGGTIKLVPESAKLNQFGGSAQAIASVTEQGGLNGTVNAALNVPVMQDVAALRLVVTEKRLSGWIARVSESTMPIGDPADPTGSRGNVAGQVPDHVTPRSNNTRLDGIRASMVIQPNDRLNITPSFLYQRTRLGAPDTFDGDPGCCKHYEPDNIAEPFRDQFSISSLKVDYDFNAVTLTSVSGYSKRQKRRVEDESESLQRLFGLPSYSIAGGGLGPITNVELNSTGQFTQELRLTSNDEGRFRWILGVFLSRLTARFHGESDGSPEAAQAVLGNSDIFHQSIEDVLLQKAIFGNVSYDITKDLKITTGVRVFGSSARDATSSTGYILGDSPQHDTGVKSSGTTPMVNASYSVDPTSMVYATIAKGYREGAAQQSVGTNCGGDLAALGLTAAPLRYNPDSVWSYELGSKNRFFNNSLTLNVAAYAQDWMNVQRFVTLPTCGYVFVANAKKAQSTGFEIEAAYRVLPGMTVNLAVGHTHAFYVDDDPEFGSVRGQRLEGVVGWTASSSLQFDRPLTDRYDLTSNLGVNYTGHSLVNRDVLTTLPAFTLFDGRVGVKADKWSGTLFVDNITNRHPSTNIGDSLLFTLVGLDKRATARPRTIGFDFSHTF